VKACYNNTTFVSEGAVGTECSTKDECGKNEDCGIGGVCECDPGYNIVEGGCFNGKVMCD
jgi:hypothetical protein